VHPIPACRPYLFGVGYLVDRDLREDSDLPTRYSLLFSCLNLAVPPNKNGHSTRDAENKAAGASLRMAPQVEDKVFLEKKTRGENLRSSGFDQIPVGGAALVFFSFGNRGNFQLSPRARALSISYFPSYLLFFLVLSFFVIPSSPIF
jgi:hypothetical protein